MKKTHYVAALAFLMAQGLHAQIQTQYIGLRADVGFIQASRSEAANVKLTTAFGGGMSYCYPYSPKLDFAIDIVASFYSMTSDRRTLNGSLWSAPTAQTINISAGDVSYVMLYGFGEAHTFKLGGGLFYGFISKSSGAQENEYWGTSTLPANNYNVSQLFAARARSNYGAVIEGIYNVNDKLQFSARYKLGLANLYNQPSGSSGTWNQSVFSLGVMYFFNAEGRGGTKKKVDL
jgi:hypothetical protein